ncbi:MAG: ATP synthase F0 subunit C [Syntrophaceae bacterium]|nr:ATP synthase F0 subunit C [Syntrophaceae bacterium]
MLHKLGMGILTAFTSIVVLLLTSPLVFAVEAIPVGESYSKVYFVMGAMGAAAFSIAIAAYGVGMGIGRAASSACEAVGRNPAAQGKIMMTMLIGMAMAESIAIYALVISLILIYANPYMSYFLG